MGKQTDRALLSNQMGLTIQVNGQMISKMVKEKKDPLEAQLTKGSMLMGKNEGKEFSS